jgi:hypothetical protein
VDLTMARDLLGRHINLSHNSQISAVVEAVQPSTLDDEARGERSALELFWDPDFIAQDMLPSLLFDTDFLGLNLPASTEPPEKSQFIQFSSRLPKLNDAEDDATGDTLMCNGVDNSRAAVENPPWILNENVYNDICVEVQNFSAVVPNGCTVPAQNTLIRCLEKYLRCVQEFLPFIHYATFRPEEKPVELLLAIAALGSQYLFERSQSYVLYFIAKAVLSEKMRREDLQSTSSFLLGQEIAQSGERDVLERIQTLILLLQFAAWGDKKISNDLLDMGGQLAVLVRNNGISKPEKLDENIEWLSWVAIEEKRRTLFAAFVLINLHSIVFDTPPLILNHEIGLCLPGYAAQWRMSNAVQWKQSPSQHEVEFQVGLSKLFSVTQIAEPSSVSSFANYILIQGIIQEMSNEHHKLITKPQSDNIKLFEMALSRWQSSWETIQESMHDSNLDPVYEKGPFALTGAALFRLAYIRLSSDHSLSSELLLSRDPHVILRQRNQTQRSLQVNRAVLHAAHSLSIPVRLGVTFMTTTKTAIWSLEHSICSLESAILLKGWLDTISHTIRSLGEDILSKIERRLLEIIMDIIRGSSLASTLDIPEDYASKIQRMACTVINIWAAIFQGVNLLDIENTIGASLQLLAETNPN